jgi:hypothetical protein
VLRFDRELGWFELRFCAACGFCDWYARGIEELEPDDCSIRLVQLKPRDDRGPGGGPYR